MQKRSIYIETTIVSYLTARPSRDLIRAAHEALTREWWEYRRQEFELFTSELVVEEATRGNQEAARRRLDMLQQLRFLDTSEEAADLAVALVEEGPLPQKAADDAGHLALAATGGMDFLLTWNCRHLANARLTHAVAAVMRSKGHTPPVITTPEGLLELEE